MISKPITNWFAALGRAKSSKAPESLFHRDGYQTIFDDDAMTVLKKPGDPEACIVAFTGVGHSLGGGRSSKS